MARTTARVQKTRTKKKQRNPRKTCDKKIQSNGLDYQFGEKENFRTWMQISVIFLGNQLRTKRTGGCFLFEGEVWNSEERAISHKSRVGFVVLCFLKNGKPIWQTRPSYYKDVRRREFLKALSSLISILYGWENFKMSRDDKVLF